MERYSEYKDSGYVCLKKLPSHWRMASTIYMLSMPLTDGPHETPKLYDNGIPFISANAIAEGFIDFEHKRGYISQSYYEECCKKYIPQKYDVYMTKSGASTGRVAIVETEEKFTIWSPLAVFRANKDIMLPYFLKYALQSNMYQQQVINNWSFGTQQNIGMRVLEKLKIVHPPLSEQHSIVSFLDFKCSKIDEWISKKQKEVELLGEAKQRIIADAVTRGLNPNVKMKKTGIAWLEEVPEHWRIERAKNLFNKEQRPIRQNDEIVTCFRDGEVTLRKNRRTTGFTEATDYSHYQHICKGDLVIHQMDAFAGSSGVSDSDGMGTPVLSVCTPKANDIDNYYYAHIVRLMGHNGFILSLYRGIRERSSDFRFDTFAKQYLPVPPLSEQHTIVSYITSKTTKIDSLMSSMNKEIEHLKEYKQRLISDVVTGQIKVC